MFAGMSRSDKAALIGVGVLGTLCIVLVVVYAIALTVDGASKMSGLHTVDEIDGRAVGYYNDISIQGDAISVRGVCGIWTAPMQLNVWLGTVSVGEFERRMALACTDSAWEVTEPTLAALRGAKGWSTNSDFIWFKGNRGTLRLYDE